MKAFAILALALAAFGVVSQDGPAETPTASVVTVADEVAPVAFGVPDVGLSELPAVPTPAPAVAEPMEDEPGWDCSIHGNKACSAEELAVLTAVEPMEDEPGFDCHIHGNKACSADELAALTTVPAEVAPAPVLTVAEPMEDEPGFDCRIHGNRACSAADLAAQR